MNKSNLEAQVLRVAGDYWVGTRESESHSMEQAALTLSIYPALGRESPYECAGR